MKTEQPTLSFKVHAELKSVIGKDLINSDSIAVIELVKNAYDAGSPYAYIEFKGLSGSESEGSIEIKDLGCGMDIEDLKTKWLNIAWSEKRISQLKFEKRNLAGNKGIGRFSCDRLGRILNLYTKKKDKDGIKLSIDWLKFENAGIDKEISHVPVEYSYISDNDLCEIFGLDAFQQGTLIKISGLRSTWNEKNLLSLRRELERFASPFQDTDIESFEIRFICEDFLEYDKKKRKEGKKHEVINGKIQNLILQALSDRTSSIESNIDKDREYITTTIFHRGNPLLTLVEKNPYRHLGNIKIQVLYLSPRDKAIFTKRMGYQPVQFGSILLFLNGFRISPYGEENNDWLAIDRHKQQQSKGSLGTREVMGCIEIVQSSSNENGWRIISNREGLVRTPNYNELTARTGYFHRVFLKLQKYVTDGIRWDSVKTTDLKEFYDKIISIKDPDDIKDVDVKFKEREEEKELSLLNSLKGIIFAGGTSKKNIELVEFDDTLADILKKQEKKLIDDFFSEFTALAVQGNRDDFSDFAKNLKSFRQKIAQSKELYDRQQKELAAAQSSAIHYQQMAIEAEAKAEEAEQRVRDTESKLQHREEENLFLKATSSKDIDDVVNIMHHIISWSVGIESACRRLHWMIDSNAHVDNKKVKEILSMISSQNKRILKTARFGTRQNLKVQAVFRDGDLLKYLSDYLEELSQWRYFKDITIKNEMATGISFITSFKPLEISILVDNLIANSKKANARNFYVSLGNISSDEAEIVFSDDGNGLDKSIVDPSNIFRRGFTTTNGSGIGLNHVMDIVYEMHGKINISTPDKGGFSITLVLEKGKKYK